MNSSVMVVTHPHKSECEAIVEGGGGEWTLDIGNYAGKT